LIGVKARSTIEFAAIGDHARLPARFFARLFASGGSLAAAESSIQRASTFCEFKR
jgi:hypothetical protein